MVINLTCFILMGFFDDLAQSVAYGFGNLIYLFFSLLFTSIASECTGILCESFFHDSDYKGLRLTYYRGYCLNFMILAIDYILFVKIDAILILCGFPEELAVNVHSQLLWMFPALFFQAITQNLKNYIIAMDIDKLLGYLNIPVYLVFPVLCWVMIWHCKQGLIGFALVKLIFEIFYQGVLTAILLKSAKPHTYLSESFVDICGKGFKKYLCFYFSHFFSGYSEHIGPLTNTILLCSLRSEETQLAWVSLF